MLGVVMVLLNIWSVGHFLQWAAVGRFLLDNWYTVSYTHLRAPETKANLVCRRLS